MVKKLTGVLMQHAASSDEHLLSTSVGAHCSLGTAVSVVLDWGTFTLASMVALTWVGAHCSLGTAMSVVLDWASFTLASTVASTWVGATVLWVQPCQWYLDWGTFTAGIYCGKLAGTSGRGALFSGFTNISGTGLASISNIYFGLNLGSVTLLYGFSRFFNG